MSAASTYNRARSHSRAASLRPSLWDIVQSWTEKAGSKSMGMCQLGPTMLRRVRLWRDRKHTGDITGDITPAMHYRNQKIVAKLT